MKVEGGGGSVTSGTTATSLLQKIKVKEEAQEQQVMAPKTCASTSPNLAISSVTERSATPASNSDVSPVDLDTKSRSNKVASRENKSTIDTNGTDSRSSITPSPSTSPTSKSQNQQNSIPRATSSLSTRSPDSDDNCSSRQINNISHFKNEDESRCINRSIAEIFCAHGKLKRLLGTLVHFAMDISSDTGDTVRTLVLKLLSDSMSAEEFHSALQGATNFPLRGFVLPYLKQTLPALQRDLAVAARAENQTCAQYLRTNESSVLEAVGLTPNSEVVEPFTEHNMVNNSGQNYSSAVRPTNSHVHAVTNQHFTYGNNNNKRRGSDALYYENGSTFEDGLPYGKRPASLWALQHPPTHSHPLIQHHQQQHASEAPYCWYSHPHQPSQNSHSFLHATYGISHLPGHQQAAIPHAGTSAASSNSNQNGSSGSLDDEWKNIHVMLNCILGMVDKTKRALAILQRRGCTSPATAATSIQTQTTAISSNGPQTSTGPQSQPQQMDNVDRDGAFKRLSGEIVAQTIRATEDRVAEVKRRAEEAVQEVKRAAVAEVQRALAVAVAESRANERLRSQRYLDSLHQNQNPRVNPRGRPSPFVRLNNSRTSGLASSSTILPNVDDSDKESNLPNVLGSNCWNCGRSALETCGGCGIARYCGSFCQHRDWEAGGHHATCQSSTSANQQTQERNRSSTPSPTSDVDTSKNSTVKTNPANN